MMEKHRILVVDDLADWRVTLGGLLADGGCSVETAESTAGALELLRTSRFDLALVDVRLDESDEDNVEGLNLAAEIKRRWPNVKVVIITGYGTVAMIRQALEPDNQGQPLVADYIPKTETEHLLTVVKRLLSQ